MLVNALSLNMLPTGFNGTLRVRPATEAEARQAALQASAVGHADLARLLTDQLGCLVPLRRETVQLHPGDTLVVAQYRGERLAPGQTELPAGARFEYVHVSVQAEESH